MPHPSERTSDFFLPDFCGLRIAFGVFVLAELFAFILTLADYENSANPWNDLAFTTLFMLWAGLMSSLVLCLSRRLLNRFSTGVAAVIAYLLLLVTLLLISEVAYQLIGSLLFESSITHLEYLLRNLAISAIVIAIGLRYFYVTHQWKIRVRAEAQARLEALQARIRPHFLFNSMNTIASLITTHPEEAEAAIVDLADLFRASLRSERRVIPLGEEIALCRRYLHMEQLRLGERLRVDWQLDGLDEENLLFPPLVLQPLVENAVYHGVEPRPDGGTITISLSVEEGMLRVEVSNPLAGEESRQHEGNRIALDNIRERLTAQYDGAAAMVICERDALFVVEITLPAEEEANADPDRR